MDLETQNKVTGLIEYYATNIDFDADSNMIVFSVTEPESEKVTNYSMTVEGNNDDDSLVLRGYLGYPLTTFHQFSHANEDDLRLIDNAIFVLTEGYRYIG